MSGVNYVTGVKRFRLHTKTFPRSHLAQMSPNERSANSVTLRCATERDPKASTFVTIRMLSHLALYRHRDLLDGRVRAVRRRCGRPQAALRAALAPDVGKETAEAPATRPASGYSFGSRRPRVLACPGLGSKEHQGRARADDRPSDPRFR